MLKRIITCVLIAVCLAVIGYEAYHLYSDTHEYKVAEKEYEDLIAMTTNTVVNPEDAPEVVEFPLLSIDYDYLKSVNSDFTAWLYFPCLDISYPVVKENTIDEYIKLTFDGTVNSSGCLFEDVLSDENFCGFHDMVFGHNMRNGTMFGKLKYLSQKEYLEKIDENPYVYVYTPTAIYQYRVFAYYVTTVGSEAYSVVETKDEYDAFVDFANGKTQYSPTQKVNFDNYDSILTLSTCSGRSGSGKRFVVHTIKTKAWRL